MIDLDQQLREYISEDPRSLSQLAKDANVPLGRLYKFVNRHEGIRLSTANKLFHELGLMLIQPRPRKFFVNQV